MLAVSAVCFFRKSRHKLVITGAGIFAALFALFLPSESFEGISDTINTVIISIVRAIKVFGLNEDFFASEFDFGTLPLWFSIIYVLVLNLLYLIAPLLTFSIILSLFGNVSSGIKLLLSSSKNVYIFSDSNTRSEGLARNLKNNSQNAVVFFNTDASMLREQNNTICFSSKITDINLFLISFIKHITFFICNEDETANLNTSIKLIEILKKSPKLAKPYSYDKEKENGIDLYVFTSLKKAEPILNGTDSKGIRVRRINEAQRLIYNFLYKNPVLQYANGNNEINLAVIGLGQYGEEYLRAAVWSGQDLNCKLNINVFDSRKVSKDFTVKYPELIHTEQLKDKAEINYKINFFDGEENDIFTTENISVMKNSHSVFIALGDDEKNFEAAIYMRECFERMGVQPDIHTVLSDVDYKAEEVSIAVADCGQEKEDFLIKILKAAQSLDYKLKVNVFDKQIVKTNFKKKYRACEKAKSLPKSSDANFRIKFYRTSIAEANEKIVLAAFENNKQGDYIKKLCIENPIIKALILDIKDNEREKKIKYITQLFENDNDNNDRLKEISIECFTDDIDYNKINIVNHKKQSYNISFIFPDNIFIYDNILNNRLEEMGKKMFNKWRKKESTDFSSFYDFEFNYRSSIAASMFWQIRKKLKMDTNPKSENNKKLEHIRWNAYMRSEGFRYSPSRNDIAKLHSGLVPYDEVNADTKEYDSYAIESVSDDVNVNNN